MNLSEQNDLSANVTDPISFETQNLGLRTGLFTVPPVAKSRIERPEKYPMRYPVTDALSAWGVSMPDYAPAFYEAPSVLQNDSRINPAGWAHPQDLTKKELFEMVSAGTICSHLGEVLVDQETGRPLNPVGRTGVSGRGLLGKWGANFAVDPLVTRWNSALEIFEMVLIQRKSGEWALPGGMVDAGETGAQAILRELKEETGIVLNDPKGILLYQGYVDDPRSTDNAWFETTVELFFCADESSKEIEPKPGVDERAARWAPMVPSVFHSLYASHGYFAELGLKKLMGQNLIS